MGELIVPNWTTLGLLALGAILVGAALPERALGQSAAMLPPGRPGEGSPAPAAAQSAAIDAVTGALTSAGVAVIGSEDAQRRMIGEPFAECAALECGGAVARSLGVDYAVLVTVWAPRGLPTSVVVTLIGPNDSAAGDAPVDGGDVAAATLAALTTARQRWQASQMGFLVVRSTPEGADVEVDERVVGQTPVRHLVPAGQRRVRVHLEGYEPVERSVRVEAMREHPLDLTLSPAGTVIEPAPAAAITRTEPHFASFLVGGALVAGGLAALVSPVWTAATEGECVEEVGPGLCRSSVRFGTVSGILMAVGIAAIAGGAAFMIVHPIEVTVSVVPDSAMLELHGRF